MELVKPLGIGLLAVAGLGVVYLSSEASSNLISLHESEEYKTKNNTFGHKFAYYFLSTTRSENNSKWRRKAESLKNAGAWDANGFFKDLASNATKDQLKNICKTKYDQTNFSNAGDEDKWKEVWTYCSLGEQQPTTINGAKDSIKDMSGADSEKAYTSTSTGASNKFGEKLKTSAISTYDKGNDWFWNIREEEFKAGNLDANGATSTYFNKNKEGRKTIQLLCREAYEKTAPNNNTETDDNPTEDNVKKYCTLEGK